jgi:hypothetical protein
MVARTTKCYGCGKHYNEDNGQVPVLKKLSVPIREFPNGEFVEKHYVHRNRQCEEKAEAHLSDRAKGEALKRMFFGPLRGCGKR